MLENWNSSFNLPSYSNFYADYSHSYQRDNYKCKVTPSGKPNGKFAENAGFINPGNYQLGNLLEVPDNIPVFVIPGNSIITTCSDTYDKVENCAVYRCVKQGFCVFYLNTGKMPIWAGVLIDIFIIDPFGRFYLEEKCTIVGIDFSCVFCDSEAQANSFRNQVEHTANNWDKLYWPYPGIDPGDPQVRCTLTVTLTYYVPTSDFGLYCGAWDFPGITSYHEIISDEYGTRPGDAIDTEETYYVGECGAYDCEPWRMYGEPGWLTRACVLPDPDRGVPGKTTIGGVTRNRVYRRDPWTRQMVECFVGFHVSAYVFQIIKRYPLGSKVNIPKLPTKSCFFNASLYIYCDRLGQRWDVPIEPDPRSPHPPPYRPPSGPDRPRLPKENPPDCMQPCTCEDVERLIAKYMNKSIYGHGILDSCSSRVVEWSGDGLQGISKGLEAVVSAINDLGRALCPELRGNFSLPDCKKGTSNFDYHGKGIQGLSKQIEALAKGLRHTTGELCEARSDIMTEAISIPQKVQIQLSDDFALVVGKLNEILSKLGKDDNIFSKVVQIITLIATLLGLLNDIRALFDRQKDYTPDLESIKNMLKELERLLKPTLQGSIDAIRCDGTINSNSWGGEGLEGLNQAITALGVNMAILHSDICELLGKKLDEMKPPLLQGSVDAIRCDGSISSNSWEGEGFDGLNQAITALGVNLAILHSDLCELLEKTDEIKPPRLQGSVDAIRCDGTISSNFWDGEGFDGLNQAITAIGTNLAILHGDLCELLKDEKDTFEIADKYKCGEKEINVKEKIENTTISRELRFLYERLKRIELLICELEECNAVPVFPGDSIEERNIPNQAVITFVESKHYPYLKGSKWHINIPYPKDDLISQTGCWQRFANLTIEKGDVYGRLVWKSPNQTINRFWTAIYGKSEETVRQFLTRISQYSKLEVAGIRISKGANPRARPKNVTVQAVKVALLERDDKGTLTVTKCCRAPKR